MNVVTLHILHAEPSADFGLLRLATPALDPEARVVLWEGLPPSPPIEDPCLAPVVLQGDVGGQRVYAEQVPTMVRLADVDISPGIAGWVGQQLVSALLALHGAGRVHGSVDAHRVFLGTEGQVVLAGSGRQGGSEAHDLGALVQLLHGLGLPITPSLSVREIARQLPLDTPDASLLGQRVRARIGHRPPVIGQVYVQVGPSPDSLDEVVPDLGPDGTDGEGLLDRWSVRTSSSGELTYDPTGATERTDAGAGASSPLALTLWTRLAAPPEHTPPRDRFEGVMGEASRGLRALLLEEAPDSLPALLGGDVGPFLLDPSESSEDDLESVTDNFDLEITPGLDPDMDEDGDTAVYTLHEELLARAVRKADAQTALADLEARITEAEQRAEQAERRARLAEERAHAPHGTDQAYWRVFTKPEVLIAIVLAGLLVYLLTRLLGG